MRGRITRWAWLAIGAALVLLPAFPVPRWVGAADQGPLWTPNLRAWGLGLLLILALAVGAARLATGIRVPRLPRLPLKPAWVVALFTVALVVLAGWVMRSIFASNPQFTDEMAQLLQARIFAAGRLARPCPLPARGWWTAGHG